MLSRLTTICSFQKFVARKARKFQTQGRLALPVLEIAYVFLGITHAPRLIITTKMLPEVEKRLALLKEHEKDPKKYEGGHVYYDDLALARFLEGVCCRYVAYPVSNHCPLHSWISSNINHPQDPDAIVDENDNCQVSCG